MVIIMERSIITQFSTYVQKADHFLHCNQIVDSVIICSFSTPYPKRSRATSRGQVTEFVSRAASINSWEKFNLFCQQSSGRSLVPVSSGSLLDRRPLLLLHVSTFIGARLCKMRIRLRLPERAHRVTNLN